MNRLLTLTAFALATTTLALPSSLQQTVKQLSGAQSQVVAYLPALNNVSVAQALKDTVNRNIAVIIMAPRNAHMIPGSFLPSLILSNAETPPRPLAYHFISLKSPPFLLIDGRTIIYGQGLADGFSSLQTANPAFLNYATQVARRTLPKSPAVPAQVVLKEFYHLEN